MLQLPNLDDQSVQYIVETAIRQIKSYGENWEGSGIHDPGITFVELLAYLKKLQQQSINELDSKSLLKFLAFLDIRRQSAKAASAHLFLSTCEDVYLPKGTSFFAFDLHFETTKRAFIQNNEIIALGHMNCEKLIVQGYKQNESNRKINLFGQHETKRDDFYIILKKPLPQKKTVSFYFEVEFENFAKRNPLEKGLPFFPLSNLIWEYYGEKEGILGWHKIESIEDETSDFLYSGCILFCVDGEMKSLAIDDNICFQIRVRVLHYGYESVPYLKSLYMNVLTLNQQETLCETIKFNYGQFLENKMIFDSFTASYGKYSLLIKKENAFEFAECSGLSYLVKPLPDMLFQLGTSNRESLKERFGGLTSETDVFLLILYSERFYEDRFLGSGNGFADEMFQMKGKQYWETVLMPSLNLMVRGNKKRGSLWELWCETNSFDTETAMSKKYMLNPETGAIKFGNNIKGRVPSIGDNNILITSLKLTAGAKGNIQKGTMKCFMKDSGFIQAEMFKSAEGGRNQESVKELLERATHVIKKSNMSAVTAEDYGLFTLKTPGLIVNNATVIPLYKPYMENYPINKIENTITIVVEPFFSKQKKLDLTAYIENILTHLNRVKLITTKLYVMTPQYLPLDVYVEIEAQMEYTNAEEIVRKALEKAIESQAYAKPQNENNSVLQFQGFGVVIYHGVLHQALEGLEIVSYVKYLKLELMDGGIKDSHFGDVLVPPYAKVFLRKVYLDVAVS